jgi:hypothetical protein
VFSVHVSAPYSKILWTKAWHISFFGFVKDSFALINTGSNIILTIIQNPEGRIYTKLYKVRVLDKPVE